MRFNLRTMKFQTKSIHAGEEEFRVEGAINLPIFQSSTYMSSDEGGYHDVRYMRLNNSPNHLLLHQKLAALEGAEAALVTASGMAAISTTLLTLVNQGEHMLAQNSLYGGTDALLHSDLSRTGVEFNFIDAHRPDSWEAGLRKNTKLIYVESLTNPLLRVGDLKAVVQFAKSHNLISVIDNTFPSPVNFRPLELGFDVCVHSATKYLNGHSDVIAGAVIGKQSLVKRITHKLNHLGGMLDVHAAFLLNRGLKTLPLRVKQQNKNALELAQFLEAHPRVKRVIYPGLKSHPDHERAQKLFDGSSGMLSFEIDGTVEQADSMIKNLRYPMCAASLGGVESLITRPVTSSHASLSKADRERAGISEELIRVSVGLEDIDDLKADFDQALHQAT